METLQKQYKFKDFSKAMDFVNKVAQVAEARDHHPDIEILYNKVNLTYYTHTDNGVTEKDRRLAAEINDLFETSFKDLA
jgi:4a-hydroxytetrahydrobiopterin dehydratase